MFNNDLYDLEGNSERKMDGRFFLIARCYGFCALFLCGTILEIVGGITRQKVKAKGLRILNRSPFLCLGLGAGEQCRKSLA